MRRLTVRRYRLIDLGRQRQQQQIAFLLLQLLDAAPVADRQQRIAYFQRLVGQRAPPRAVAVNSESGVSNTSAMPTSRARSEK